MNISTALAEGLVEGISEKPERFVETVMSDVFIYKDVVRKVYKERKGLFVDMTNPAARKKFYTDDFLWNQSVSPDIHTAHHGVITTENGSYRLANPDSSEIWLIEMKRIDDGDTLFKRLTESTATTKDVTAFTKTQTESLARLTKDHLSDHEDLLERGLAALWETRLDNDLRQFGKSFGGHLALETTDARVDTLLNFLRTSEFLQNLGADDASILVDNHAGNVVFHQDKAQFIDIFLPKREWRVLDHHNNISRIAACVRVLGNDELADAMYSTYGEYHELAPREIYDFQEAYNALIKGYYYTYLQKRDIAERYFAFADATLARL